MVGRAVTIAGQLGNVSDADSAAAVGRNGKHPGLKSVRLGPFDQPRINAPAFQLLEDAPGLVFLNRHAVDHRAVDIEGITADGGPFRQREVEMALHDAIQGVGKGHRDGRFGDRPDDAHLGLQLGKPQRRRAAILLDHQCRRDRLAVKCRTEHQEPHERKEASHSHSPDLGIYQTKQPANAGHLPILRINRCARAIRVPKAPPRAHTCAWTLPSLYWSGSGVENAFR